MHSAPLPPPFILVMLLLLLCGGMAYGQPPEGAPPPPDTTTIPSWWKISMRPTQNGLAISRDGNNVAAARENVLYVWDARNGALRFTHTLPYGNTLGGVGFTPDSRYLAFGANPIGTTVLDMETMKPVARYSHERSPNVEFSADGRYFASSTGPILVRDRYSGEILRRIGSSDNTFSFSPDSRSIAHGDPRTGTIEIVAIATGKSTRPFGFATVTPSNKGYVNPVSLVFTLDGKRLIATNNHGELRIWRLSDGAPEHAVSIDSSEGFIPPRLSISPDGETLLVAYFNGRIEFRSPLNGELRRSMQGPPDLNYARYAPNGRHLLLYTYSSGAMLVSADDCALVQEFNGGHLGTVTELAHTGDGGTLFSGSNSGTINCWDAATGKIRWAQWRQGSLLALEATSDGRLLDLRSGPKRDTTPARARQLDIRSGNVLREWTIEGGKVILGKYSRNGWLACVHADGTITLHDPQMRHAHSLRAWKDGSTALAFSPDGSSLAVGDSAGTLRIIDTRTGGITRQLHIGLTKVSAITFSRDGALVIASSPPNLSIWRLADSSVRKITPWGASNLEVSDDGKWLVTSYSQGCAVWSLRDLRMVHILQARSPGINDGTLGSVLAIAPGGRRIVTGSRNGTLVTWNISEELLAGSVPPRQEPPPAPQPADAPPPAIYLGSLGFGSPDTTSGASWARQGKWGPVAAFLEDGTVLLEGRRRQWVRWDPQADTERVVRENMPVSDMRLSPDGSLVAVGMAGYVALIDPDSISKRLPGFTPVNYSDRTTSVDFSGDGTLAAAMMSRVGTVVWETATGKEVAVIDTRNHGSQMVRFAPDGRSLAISYGSDSIFLHEVPSGRLLRTFLVPGPLPHDDRTPGAQFLFTPDGRRLAGTSGRGTLALWQVSTGALQWSLPVVVRQYDEPALALAPNGREIAVSNANGVLIFYRITDGKELRRINVATRFDRIIYSRDGRRLLGYGPGISPMVIDLAAGRILREYGNGYISRVTAITHSHDGKTVAAAAGDDVRLWSTETGKPLARFLSRSGRKNVGVIRLAFSRNGNYLAMVLRSYTDKKFGEEIAVRDATSGKLLLSLQGKCSHPVATVAADASRAALACGDSTVTIYSLPDGRERTSLATGTAGIAAMGLSADGGRLAVVGNDGVIRLFDAAGGALLRQSFRRSFGRDYTRVLILEGDSAIILESKKGGATIWFPHNDSVASISAYSGIFSLSLTKDRQWIAGAVGHNIHVWWFPQKRLTHFFNGDRVNMNFNGGEYYKPDYLAVSISPDGSSLVGGTKYGAIHLWKTTGRVKYPELHDR